MENTKLSPWERIEDIIDHYRFHNVSAFARRLGLGRAENLYQIKRGNNGISMKLAETIHSAFPEISKAWLLTGEDEMLAGNSANSPTHIHACVEEETIEIPLRIRIVVKKS